MDVLVGLLYPTLRRCLRWLWYDVSFKRMSVSPGRSRQNGMYLSTLVSTLFLSFRSSNQTYVLREFLSSITAMLLESLPKTGIPQWR